jgi:hypothetical protein
MFSIDQGSPRRRFGGALAVVTRRKLLLKFRGRIGATDGN